MQYIASQFTMSETSEDLFNDSHLQLQERMRIPVTFNAEMIGDIMYLQQALRQPDTKEFIQAVIKEVNRHLTATIGHCKRNAKSLKTST
jgi:hypothetical protein